jgi:hypothetical protein
MTYKAWVIELRRAYLARRNAARLISDSDCFFWPTPTASVKGGACFNLKKDGQVTLQTAVARWPTPTTSDAQKGGPGQFYTAGGTGLTAAVHQWATPTVKGNYNKVGLTPKSSDGLSTQVNRLEAQQGQLNPYWVELLMGFEPGWTVVE